MWKLVLYSSFLAGALAADKSVTAGGVTTKVLGQSGKIKVYKAGGNESEGVTITMDAIKELDSSNASITRHSFNNFATMDFTFSEQTETKYQDTDINVTQFSFTADISVGQGQQIDGMAKLTTYVYMFQSDGNITVDGKNVTVTAGKMKFNVKLEYWPFCGVGYVTCTQGQTNQTGAFLDFYVEIKGKGNATSSSGSDKTYDLGGATVVVPTEVVYTNSSNQNETKAMPKGYPKLETTDSKQTFIFRFERFTKSALYDPILQLAEENNSTTDPSTTAAPNTTAAPTTTGAPNTTASPTPTFAPNSSDQNIVESGVSLKVQGQSGKITFSNSEGKAMTVEFDNLKEKTSAGADIKDNNHGVNNFASQTFTFGNQEDVIYTGTNITAKKLVFSADIKNGTKVMVDMYIFKQSGNISLDSEDTVVTKGDLKFSVTISGWTFCNGTQCQQSEVGDFLDFDIVIKGAKGATKATSVANKPDRYDVGSGNVFLSKKLKKDDGSYENMAETYPMLIAQDSKQIFRLRFPKFNSKVFYDPTLSLVAGTGGGAGAGGSAAISASCLLLLLASLFAMAINGS